MEYADWLSRDLEDHELYRVYQRFQQTVQESDEFRDFRRIITLYRDAPFLRDMINMIFVAQMGWRLPTLITGQAEDGAVPPEFKALKYDDL
jgi:hypothetical protein